MELLIENSPQTVEQRRIDFANYDGSFPVQMIQGHKIYVQPGCKTSETYFVFRRQHIKELVALARLDFQLHPQYQEILAGGGRGGLAVDVGANVGYVASWLATRPDVAEVVAIEPNPAARAILDLNASLHGKIVVDHRILGAKDGNRSLHIYESSGWSSALKLNTQETIRTIKCEQIALDALLKHKHPLFIKIDVQGAESDVLLGGLETIERCRPIIWLEYTPEDVGSSRSALEEVFLEAMKSAKLECFSISEDGSLILISDEGLASFSGDLLMIPEGMPIRNT